MSQRPSKPATGAPTAGAQQSTAADLSEEVDQTRDRLLDAAYDQFCRVGIQRTSMEEVARRANLSRITLYRKFATKNALVEQVTQREFRKYFTQFLVDIAPAESVEDRIVLGFVSSLRAISNNALIAALVEAEHDVQQSILGDGGRTLRIVRKFVASQLLDEQRAHNISNDIDVNLVAEMIVRVTASLLIIPSSIVDLEDDRQMESIARQFLVPMVKPEK